MTAIKPGQLYRDDRSGVMYEVIQCGTRRELGLPLEDGMGIIFPFEGLVKAVRVTPPEPFVVKDFAFLSGKTLVA